MPDVIGAMLLALFLLELLNLAKGARTMDRIDALNVKFDEMKAKIDAYIELLKTNIAAEVAAAVAADDAAEDSAIVALGAKIQGVIDSTPGPVFDPSGNG